MFATALISGVSVYINKFGVSGINSSVYAFSRSLAVSLLILAIMLFAGQWRKLKALPQKQWLSLCLVGLVGGSIPFLLFFKGLQLTASSAGASLIQKTMFVFVAVLALVFLKERFSKAMLAGTLALLAGSYLFLGTTGFAWDYGSTLILAATALWAVENVLSKHFLKEMDGTVLAFGRMLFGAGFILAFLLASGEAVLIPALSATQVSWIAVTSVILCAYVLTWYNGLKQVSATTATAILLLGAPVTTLLNVLSPFSRAAITPTQVFGGILLFAGVGLMALASERSERSQPAASSTA